MNEQVSLELPAPVQAYRLPNGEFVTTPEEYYMRIYENDAEFEAGAFVLANAQEFSRGQDTRAFNTIKWFVSWRAGASHTGKLATFHDAYRAHLESLKSKPAKEPAQEPAEPQTAAPVAPVAPAVQQIPLV